MFTFLKQLAGMLLLVIFVSGAPLMLFTEKEEVVFAPERVVSRVVYLFQKFSEGSLGTYYLGFNEREISEDILPFAISRLGHQLLQAHQYSADYLVACK